VPFTPLQVLWVNLIADGPTAITLGVDEPAPGLMQRDPVPAGSPILSRKRMMQVVLQGGVTAVGVLAVYWYAIQNYDSDIPAGEAPIVAMTMAFTAFVYAQLVNVFNARSETATVFSKYTFSNWKLWASVVFVFAMQILLTVVEPLKKLFDVSSLTPAQWGLCLLPPLALLIAVELWKIVARSRASSAESASVEQ